MVLTPKAKEYGKKMQLISQMYLNKNLKRFRGGPAYKSLQWEEEDVQLMFNDASNLFLIGTYMIEGNFDAAMAIASEVDTMVRDEIPNSVWNYLEKFTIDQE